MTLITIDVHWEHCHWYSGKEFIDRNTSVYIIGLQLYV